MSMTEVVFCGDPLQAPHNPMDLVIKLSELGGVVPRIGDSVLIGPGNAFACFVSSITWELWDRKRNTKFPYNWIPEHPRRRPFRIRVHLSYARPS